MNNVLSDLGDGLLIKQATADDVERLADYNARYLSGDGPDQPDAWVENLTRDEMVHHPSMSAADFTYVEDSGKQQIVSSLCLISQTWTYENIPFGVGRVELVSTHPDYRNQGLIRAQFEVVHRWSAGRGEKVQSITGIPYFYRQFGYEMTVNLGGNRRGYRPHVPKLKEGESEQFQFRPATPGDIPFLLELYDLSGQRSMIFCPRDEEIFHYEMEVQHELSRGQMMVVEDLEEESVGFVWHGNKLHRNGLQVYYYELSPGVSWSAVTPALIRFLQRKGEELDAKDEKQKFATYVFELGGQHPAYEVAEKFLPEERKPYAWYLRVADLPDFIEHIGPVLDERLAASVHAGYQGELWLNFYRSGVKLSFEQGELSGVEPWRPTTEKRGDLSLPRLTFLHLLFGHRSFAELDAFYPDCFTNDKPEAAALVDVLFPKKASRIFGIE